LTDPGFCPFVLEIFYLGITTGTTPTTYDPSSTVTRLQMAAFLSRTVSNGSDFVSIWKARGPDADRVGLDRDEHRPLERVQRRRLLLDRAGRRQQVGAIL